MDYHTGVKREGCDANSSPKAVIKITVRRRA
nr:MAG TPA: hypothetical protein [Caudoviricetes sp.]